ncbi:MAG: glycosyltransferase [Myxococcales bacterium]|nr:MAG: glycosyltransferase [Myxococcales bacterium]
MHNTASNTQKRQARQSLGLAENDRVALYAGNLDAYQGLDPVLRGFAQIKNDRPKLVVLTASNAEGLAKQILQLKLGPDLIVLALDNTEQRQRALCSADFAIVPRQIEGGLPVKLLDALALALPIVCSPKALAGLPLQAGLVVAKNNSAPDFKEAIQHMCQTLQSQTERIKQSQNYLKTHHSPQAYLNALSSIPSLS